MPWLLWLWNWAVAPRTSLHGWNPAGHKRNRIEVSAFASRARRHTSPAKSSISFRAIMTLISGINDYKSKGVFASKLVFTNSTCTTTTTIIIIITIFTTITNIYRLHDLHDLHNLHHQHRTSPTTSSWSSTHFYTIYITHIICACRRVGDQLLWALQKHLRSLLYHLYHLQCISM